MARFTLPAGALAVALAGLAGCGDNPNVTGATVAGTMRHKGAPLPGGTVRIVADGDPGKSASGRIGADGRYQVANAPVGACKVVVETESAKNDPSKFMGKVPAGAVDPGKLPPPQKYVPVDRKYTDPGTTPLRVTVVKGDNPTDFDVD